MNIRTFLPLLLAAAIVAPCCAEEDNSLSQQEAKDGWRLLFNGKDHSGWKCNNGKKIATPIEDGCLVPYKSGGYVVIHEEQFGDFILKCDVKWDEKDSCNSGIFFRIGDPKNPVHTGYEIQVLSGKGTGKHDFGAIYDLVPITENASLGGGKWNSVEIKAKGPHISVKVNGKLVAEMNTDEFTQPGKTPDGSNHKFKLDGKPVTIKNMPRKGYLGFQDHGHKVWYKNVKLLELK